MKIPTVKTAKVDLVVLGENNDGVKGSDADIAVAGHAILGCLMGSSEVTGKKVDDGP